MTHAQILNFAQAGNRAEKMLIAQRTGEMKAGTAQPTMPKVREGIPDHVVQFDEHG